MKINRMRREINITVQLNVKAGDSPIRKITFILVYIIQTKYY